MTVSPRDTLISQTLVATFRSNALGIEDRVNGLAAIIPTDGSSVTSHNYANLYGDSVTGKQLHQVVVVYLGNDSNDVNAARIFNVIIPEDADLVYYYDSGSFGEHTETPPGY